MTYIQLTPSTLISETPDVLNGVELRSQMMEIASSGSGVWAAIGNTSGAPLYELALGEAVYVKGPISERTDILSKATLHLLVAPTASEVGASVNLRFAGAQYHVGSTTNAASATTTFDSGDAAVAGTLGDLSEVQINLGLIWDSVAAGYVFGSVSRTSVISGTELVADLAIVSAKITYLIDR